MLTSVSPTMRAPAAAAPSCTSGLVACSRSLPRSSRTLLAGLTRSARASMVRARSARVCSISATRASGLFLAELFLATVPSATVVFATMSLEAVSDTATTPRGSPIAPVGSAIAPSLSRPAASEPAPWPLVSQAPGSPTRPATAKGPDERTAGCATARRATPEWPRGGYPPRGHSSSLCLARAGHPVGLVDQSLAGHRLAARPWYGHVGGGCRRQFSLDLASQLIPGGFESAKLRVGRRKDVVSWASALDGARGRYQRRRAELADARVELLVALPERCHVRCGKCTVRAGQDLRDDSAVGLVVVPQPGEVHDGRPDIGLIHPRAWQVLVGHLDVAAVWARRGDGVGSRPVQPQVLDPRPNEADVVGVDLGGVVAVIPGESGALRDARPAARLPEVLEEVVGLGEIGKRRRHGRVGIRHVQNAFLDRVGQVVRDGLVDHSRIRVGVGQRRHVVLELANHWC